MARRDQDPLEELRDRMARNEKTQRQLIEALRAICRVESDDPLDKIQRIQLLLDKRLEAADKRR